MVNTNIDHKIIAEHFQDKFSNLASAKEAMRQLIRKYEDSGTGLWIVYVKAYNYDMIQNDNTLSKKG